MLCLLAVNVEVQENCKVPKMESGFGSRKAIRLGKLEKLIRPTDKLVKYHF